MTKEISTSTIKGKIYQVRGKNVMLDRDLAELYSVQTRTLNQAVRRNIKRFPDDFMFQLTKPEMQNWVSQIVIPNHKKMGLRIPPLAFTEMGVAMLSSVLNSELAIMVNINIIRVFAKLKTLLASYDDILLKIEQLQLKDSEHDNNIQLIFEYLKNLEQDRKDNEDFRQRKRIGFKPK